MTDVTLISSSDLSTVESALKELVGELGYELVQIKVYKEYGSFAFELLIWRKEGVSLNDCEAVHNRVSDALDGYDDLFLSPYSLKISSMGLDRPIVTDDDLRRALGTEIEAKQDKKKTVGTLKAYDEETFTLSTSEGDVTIYRKNATKVQPYIRF